MAYCMERSALMDRLSARVIAPVKDRKQGTWEEIKAFREKKGYWPDTKEYPEMGALIRLLKKVANGGDVSRPPSAAMMSEARKLGLFDKRAHGQNRLKRRSTL